MQNGNESSVEEILESIKRVIARDNREGAAALRERRETQGMPEPADADEAEEILDLAAANFVEQAYDEDAGESVDDDGADAPLVNEARRASMAENFAALAMLSQPGVQPQIVRSGETSLEGLVREMLRPMLAEWLDQNLPGMVEKLVREEIARIAGKRG